MARGELRIYLGASPGVGKTYAMLDEGRRRAERGADVVIGALDTHGRAATSAQVHGLPLVPEQAHHTGSAAVDLDVDAVVARRPAVVLVDDLARSDVRNGDSAPRHRAVAELLDAGIDVLTTIDIGQLESLGEIVEGITGIPHGPLVPDRVVRLADQIHLVDQTPEALRRRLAHGNVYPAEQVGPDIANAFRIESLTALRELTLSWMANRAEERSAASAGRGPGWETREVVVVALTGSPSSEHVIRRAARLAERQRARLIGVHVRSIDGARPPGASPELDLQRRLVMSLGGEYREVASGDVAAALVDIVTVEGATQLVVGSPGRTRWIQFSRGSLINEVLASSPVDVHVVSSNGRSSPRSDGNDRVPMVDTTFSRRRQAWGWMLAAAVPICLAASLAELHRSIGLSASLLLMVLGVTSVAVVGGARPATLAAVVAFALSNWFFIPPLHQLSISSSEDAISLLVFLVVAVAVGGFVSNSARRSAESLRARSDASTLAAMAGAVASNPDPLPTLIERLREVYDAGGAALYFESPTGWTLVASAGSEAPAHLDDAEQSLPVGPDCQLLLAGGPFRSVDRPTATAFLDQLAVAVEQRSLRVDRAEAQVAASTNELRAALLAAVSHDLRTPLASVKAAVSTLRQPGRAWPEEVRAEFLESIEAGTDRLGALITNLLDMSRIQAGAVELLWSEVRVDEVVHRAALALPQRGVALRVSLDDRLPGVHADAALLEHVITNLLDNATKWSPPGGEVVVDAQAVGSDVHVRIVDHGPGIPASAREDIRRPFQRLDDSGSVAGTGLGLAVADGFARLMDVRLLLDDTPGGGTTATLVFATDAPSEVDHDA